MQQAPLPDTDENIKKNHDRVVKTFKGSQGSQMIKSSSGRVLATSRRTVYNNLFVNSCRLVKDGKYLYSLGKTLPVLDLVQEAIIVYTNSYLARLFRLSGLPDSITNSIVRNSNTERLEVNSFVSRDLEAVDHDFTLTTFPDNVLTNKEDGDILLFGVFNGHISDFKKDITSSTVWLDQICRVREYLGDKGSGHRIDGVVMGMAAMLMKLKKGDDTPRVYFELGGSDKTKLAKMYKDAGAKIFRLQKKEDRFTRYSREQPSDVGEIGSSYPEIIRLIDEGEQARAVKRTEIAAKRYMEFVMPNGTIVADNGKPIHKWIKSDTLRHTVTHTDNYVRATIPDARLHLTTFFTERSVIQKPFKVRHYIANESKDLMVMDGLFPLVIGIKRHNNRSTILQMLYKTKDKIPWLDQIVSVGEHERSFGDAIPADTFFQLPGYMFENSKPYRLARYFEQQKGVDLFYFQEAPAPRAEPDKKLIALSAIMRMFHKTGAKRVARAVLDSEQDAVVQHAYQILDKLKINMADSGTEKGHKTLTRSDVEEVLRVMDI